LGGTSAGRNFRPTPPELPPLKRKLSTDCAEKLLLKNDRPELPPDLAGTSARSRKPAETSEQQNQYTDPSIFDGLYLSTSTHIKIYIMLTSNTQNPKGREMFFQREHVISEAG
jgi:hypothetical protein